MMGFLGLSLEKMVNVIIASFMIIGIPFMVVPKGSFFFMRSWIGSSLKAKGKDMIALWGYRGAVIPVFFWISWLNRI
jgi:hypothetical protein